MRKALVYSATAVLLAAAFGAGAAFVAPLALQALSDHESLAQLRAICARGCRGIRYENGTMGFMREEEARRAYGDECQPSPDGPTRKEIWRL